MRGKEGLLLGGLRDDLRGEGKYEEVGCRGSGKGQRQGTMGRRATRAGGCGSSEVAGAIVGATRATDNNSWQVLFIRRRAYSTEYETKARHEKRNIYC